MNTSVKYKIFQSTYLGDEDWGQMWKTITNGKTPFKYVDRLEIAFADIDATDLDNAFLKYTGENSGRAKQTIVEAKKENPEIELIAQMGWASGLLPLLADPNLAEKRLDTFAKSIPPFLKQYSLEGVDFDWESVDDPMTEGFATYLFKQTRQYLKEAGLRFMTITPDGAYPTGQYLNISTVNELFDAVIVQSYNRVGYIDNYISAGINKSILYCGICSERAEFWPPNGDITPYEEKVTTNNLPGLYCWRIDNDDTDLDKATPRYTITSKMWKFSRGVYPNPPLFP